MVENSGSNIELDKFSLDVKMTCNHFFPSWICATEIIGRSRVSDEEGMFLYHYDHREGILKKRHQSSSKSCPLAQ